MPSRSACCSGISLASTGLGIWRAWWPLLLTAAAVVLVVRVLAARARRRRRLVEAAGARWWEITPPRDLPAEGAAPLWRLLAGVLANGDGSRLQQRL
ncbi:MAG: hypothetical protein GEV00_24370, partial [Actinophytocola sp.]|nr:hypothetical protein [Actinophytocola sp.]